MSKTAKLQTVPTTDKRYFSIGEVSHLCAIKPYVLRYWEQEFHQLKPVTRTGGRRYYQPKDINLIHKIRTLLYDEGFTIAGAKQKLRKVVLDNTINTSSAEKKSSSKENPVAFLIKALEEILQELK